MNAISLSLWLKLCRLNMNNMQVSLKGSMNGVFHLKSSTILIRVKSVRTLLTAVKMPLLIAI